HLDVGDGVLHSENIADVRDGIERMKRIIANALAENFFFRFVRGIAHLDAHQETVELRFGQRVRAVVLDGLLRGDDGKRLRPTPGPCAMSRWPRARRVLSAS